ncbi:MAG TPA: hypothetical protein VNZ64_08685 [Candidatus Acidoferrum sp.]|jgi:hypothetical protein|nr:hypothetical protein [Candidatus Acidoferrum sp.]
MPAINFDQPSTGNVNSGSDALSIQNAGSGNALTGVSQGGDGLAGSTSNPDVQAGVHGTASDYSAGVWGENGTRPSDFWDNDPRFSVGVRASNWSAGGPETAVAALYAETQSGYGVYSVSLYNDAVYGVSTNQANGVTGSSNFGSGVLGTSYGFDGVHGITQSQDHAGVAGISTAGQGGVGVYGESKAGPAVQPGIGVWGISNAAYGVKGDGTTGVVGNGSGIGVWAWNTAGGDGLYAATNGPGDAIHSHSGKDQGGNYIGRAGYFDGNVTVNGFLNKAGGGFKIDHPQYPANKYLVHSFVESPDMKNVYDGVVTLDAKGKATVTLPAYFQALNRDFRYQLTPIGRPAPGLHIAGEAANNKFKIAGGPPGAKVSWQVTGIRHDRWAVANRTIPEERKTGKLRGFYLHPELFGKSDQKSIARASNPKLAKYKEEQLKHLQLLSKRAAQLGTVGTGARGFLNKPKPKAPRASR